ncbi:hypothetical protein BN77_p10149 [Rhizobium mesoamericanum STM3625]|uniref:Uncharacterized protein n=1 Tax=Rhizobium mesoamericanum STM3625 TaxID=1211777 RepID=K0PWR8_9HYPH|nr:hypothetical protein BN77_p10149 [Rhizobium mesoamericanum STM3625]
MLFVFYSPRGKTIQGDVVQLRVHGRPPFIRRHDAAFDGMFRGKTFSFWLPLQADVSLSIE